MAHETTLLDLVDTLSEVAANEAEVIATVVHLVNSGTVRLCGNFKGHRFEDAILIVDEAARAA